MLAKTRTRLWYLIAVSANAIRQKAASKLENKGADLFCSHYHLSQDRVATSVIGTLESYLAINEQAALRAHKRFKSPYIYTNLNKNFATSQQEEHSGYDCGI